MNWLFGLVVLFLVVSAVIGYKKGFVKIAYGLAATIVTLFLVSILAPHVQTILIEKTPLYEKVETVCVETIKEKIEATMNETGASVSAALEQSGIKLPEALTGVVENIGEDNAQAAEVAQKIGSALAEWLMLMISFVITYIVVVILLKILEKVLNIATRLPVLKGTNKTLGVVMGLGQGIIDLWLAALMLSAMCTTELGMQLIALVNENFFLKFMYDHNGILYLISLFWK